MSLESPVGLTPEEAASLAGMHFGPPDWSEANYPGMFGAESFSNNPPEGAGSHSQNQGDSARSRSFLEESVHSGLDQDHQEYLSYRPQDGHNPVTHRATGHEDSRRSTPLRMDELHLREASPSRHSSNLSIFGREQQIVSPIGTDSIEHEVPIGDRSNYDISPLTARTPHPIEAPVPFREIGLQNRWGAGGHTADLLSQWDPESHLDLSLNYPASSQGGGQDHASTPAQPGYSYNRYDTGEYNPDFERSARRREKQGLTYNHGDNLSFGGDRSIFAGISHGQEGGGGGTSTTSDLERWLGGHGMSKLEQRKAERAALRNQIDDTSEDITGGSGLNSSLLTMEDGGRREPSVQTSSRFSGDIGENTIPNRRGSWDSTREEGLNLVVSTERDPPQEIATKEPFKKPRPGRKGLFGFFNKGNGGKDRERKAKAARLQQMDLHGFHRHEGTFDNCERCAKVLAETG